MNELINKFQTTKLTRKDFLIYSGMLLLTITGIVSLLNTLNNLDIPKGSKAKQGFGSQPYGV